MVDEFPTLDLDAIDTPADDNLELGTETPGDNLELGTETPAEGEEPAEGEGEEEEQTPADGRKLPDEVRKALKALRDSSPENAKAARALNDVYGREQAYKAVFPSVKDAVAAQGTLATIDSFGGLEGVQNTIAEIEEVDQLLRDGDPRALDKIIEVSGEGFAKIAPAMLDKLQASNPEAYAAAIRPHLVEAIGKSGIGDAFGAVIQALDISQTPGATAEFKIKWEKQATEGLGKIYQYLQGLGKTPEKANQPVQQNEAFTKREQELAQREAASFNNDVSSQANTKINTSLSKAMTPYLRGAKLDQTARAEFTQGVYDEVAKLAKADKVYQTTKDNLFKSKQKDAGKIAGHISAKFDAIVGDAVKTVAGRPQWKALLGTKGAPNPGTKPGSAPAPGGTGSMEKPVLVKELPAREHVDFNKTTDDMMMRGIRVLKSGKVVRLDR